MNQKIFFNSCSPVLPQQQVAKDVFKQPSLSLHSPSPRYLSTSLTLSGSNRAATSSTRHFTSQPVSHSTPLSSMPCRVSPRKKVFNRSHSLACAQTLPAESSKKNRPSLNAKQQTSQKKQHAPLVSQNLLHRSTSETSIRQSFHGAPSISDPPVRRSPRKLSITVLKASKYSGIYLLHFYN